jgi:hypothetical protein
MRLLRPLVILAIAAGAVAGIRELARRSNTQVHRINQ